MTIEPTSLLIGLALGLFLGTSSGQNININGSPNASVEQPTRTEVDVKPSPVKNQ
ncbi:MAG: hypothetical protein AAGD25_34430 [Cyanobacteria bacterium P01_F01_bin.150]